MNANAWPISDRTISTEMTTAVAAARKNRERIRSSRRRRKALPRRSSTLSGVTSWVRVEEEGRTSLNG